MEEVKGIYGVLMLNKREIMENFKSYIEDYNTATMPHDKYYHYERWEAMQYAQQQQYQQSQQQQHMLQGNQDLILQDEENKRLQQKQKKSHEQAVEFNLIRNSMMINKDKQEQMKKQAQLSTELQIAYKRGDRSTVKRLERLLTPDPGHVVKHPWA
jgi:hypothetical protein